MHLDREETGLCAAGTERWVADLLTERRATLLSQAELEEPVPLALDGNDDVRVFNALFQEGGILPWDKDTLRRLGLIERADLI